MAEQKKHDYCMLVQLSSEEKNQFDEIRAEGGHTCKWLIRKIVVDFLKNHKGKENADTND